MASISEQQEYYVDYGNDEGTLDQRSQRIDGSTNTTLTDYSYSISLSGLSFGTTYYYQVVTVLELFTLKSDVLSFITKVQGIITLISVKCMIYFVVTMITLSVAPTGSPVNFTAMLNGTIVSLKWGSVAEAEQNGIITSYFLTCNIGGNLAFELNLTTIEEVELGVYEARYRYSCEIHASNSAGSGPAANTSFTTGGIYAVQFTPHPL